MSRKPHASSSQATTANTTATPAVFARHFRLGEVVQAGDAVVVWSAIDQRTGEAVALKFFPPDLIRTPADFLTVRDVIAPLRQVQHPAVVAAREVATDSDYSAVVTPWIEGPTLAALRQSRAQSCFAVSDIEPWVQVLVDVFATIHGRGLVHGALTPHVIFARPEAGLCVTGFGTNAWLRLAHRALYGPPKAKNVPHAAYASPALREGAPPTPADDAFAFGTIIYELITGTLPRSGNWLVPKPPAMELQRRRDKRFGTPIPAAWEAVVQGCLEADPARRLQSFSEIRTRLGFPRPEPPAPRVVTTAVATEVTPVSSTDADASPSALSGAASVDVPAELAPPKATDDASPPIVAFAAAAETAPPAPAAAATEAPVDELPRAQATPQAAPTPAPALVDDRRDESPPLVIGPAADEAPSAATSAPEAVAAPADTAALPASSFTAEPEPVAGPAQELEVEEWRPRDSVAAESATPAPAPTATADVKAASLLPLASNTVAAPAAAEADVDSDQPVLPRNATTMEPLLPRRGPLRHVPMPADQPRVLFPRSSYYDRDRNPASNVVLRSFIVVTVLAAMLVGGWWGWKMYEVRQEYVELWRDVQLLPPNASAHHRAQIEERLEHARGRLSQEQWRTLHAAWENQKANLPHRQLTGSPAGGVAGQ